MSDSDKKFEDITDLLNQLREQCKDSVYLHIVNSRLLILARKAHPFHSTITLFFAHPTGRFEQVNAKTQEKSSLMGYQILATASVNELCNLYSFNTIDMGIQAADLSDKECSELLHDIVNVLSTKNMGYDFEGCTWRLLNEENK